MPRPTPIRGLGPDSRLAEAARRLLASRLTDVRQQEGKLAERLTEEGVHDMRVAVRRLRAALKVFRGLGALEPLEREVKQLQDALGAVRDTHVQGAWLAEVAGHQEALGQEGLLALRSRVERPLGGQERRLRRELARWAKRTVSALKRETERLEGAGRYGGRRGREPLRRRLRKVERLMEAYTSAPDGFTAHELRKQAKKLRYEAELFRPALRRAVEPLLQALVPLQEVLGELHDADVRQQLLERLATRGSAAERAAARPLLERIRHERAECAARTAHELRRWHAERLARGLRQHLE